MPFSISQMYFHIVECRFAVSRIGRSGGSKNTTDTRLDEVGSTQNSNQLIGF